MELDYERFEVYHLALDRRVATRAKSPFGSVFQGVAVDRAESCRGSGQALEARQATVLSDGARLGDRVS